MSETPTPAPALTDEQIDIVADAFNVHPMLLGYREADRMLIAGALAIAAVRALDLAAVIAQAKREERERIATELADAAQLRARQIAHDQTDRDRGEVYAYRIAERIATEGRNA